MPTTSGPASSREPSTPSDGSSARACPRQPPAPGRPAGLVCRMRRFVLAICGLVCVTTALSGSLPAQSAEYTRAGSDRTASDSARTRQREDGPVPPRDPMVGGLNLPWDAQYTRDGRLLITERSSKRLLTWRLGKLRRVELPGLLGVGRRRDRADVAGDRARLQRELEPSLLHLPGKPDRGRRARRQGDRLAPEHSRHRGDPDPDPAHRASLHEWAARRLPAADREQRCAGGRHRRCRDRDQPAGPHLAGRQDPASQPDHRSALAGATRSSPPATPTPATCSPTGTATSRGWRARKDGTLWSVEHGTSRDDEVNHIASRLQLRLEPGARVRREHPDDRPQPARHPAQREVELGVTHARRPRAPSGSAARSGAPTRTPSRSPRSRESA